jgi:hypothetical protein
MLILHPSRNDEHCDYRRTSALLKKMKFADPIYVRLTMSCKRTMTHRDDKQRHLGTAWIELGRRPSLDAYPQFIALWMAFNAYCYAHFAAVA